MPATHPDFRRKATDQRLASVVGVQPVCICIVWACVCVGSLIRLTSRSCHVAAPASLLIVLANLGFAASQPDKPAQLVSRIVSEVEA